MAEPALKEALLFNISVTRGETIKKTYTCQQVRPATLMHIRHSAGVRRARCAVQGAVWKALLVDRRSHQQPAGTWTGIC